MDNKTLSHISMHCSLLLPECEYKKYIHNTYIKLKQNIDIAYFISRSLNESVLSRINSGFDATLKEGSVKSHKELLDSNSTEDDIFAIVLYFLRL